MLTGYRKEDRVRWTRLRWTSAAAALLLVASVSARTIHVGQGRDFTTIRAALVNAKAGDSVLVHPGTYRERFTVGKSLTLIGVGRPVIDGLKRGTNVTIAADRVTLRGFRIINSGRSSLHDYCGILVKNSRNVVISDNQMRSNQFSIMLQGCVKSDISHNDVASDIMSMQVMGNAIHCWKSEQLHIHHNKVGHNRDGIYLEFVYESLIDHNTVSGCERYGLHFMFSHHNTYSKNYFSNNLAGVAVMYTHDVHMLHNVFAFNRGGSSYGLLLKEIQRGRIEHNRFTDNTVGILMDGGVELQVRHNLFRNNGWGMRVVASSTNDTIRANNFIGNTFDVSTNSSFNSNTFDGNYWDKYDGYDLDKNGTGDVPYHMLSLFSTLAEKNAGVLLFFHSFLMNLMDMSERLLPSITPDNYVDNMPSLKPFAT